ncbi:hypothetical protein SAMN05192563_10951 [Paraburkholderia aspalathi]|uniref:Uncharacterized protein n=1 Tax=Paraburkholderia aspalathi TaxID=1324617 RepID=A0A1I7ESG0_9BURK|nr:hypothetical protein SAMN05192563_10951 [Paraburkholderia aspalathi]
MRFARIWFADHDIFDLKHIGIPKFVDTYESAQLRFRFTSGCVVNKDSGSLARAVATSFRYILCTRCMGDEAAQSASAVNLATEFYEKTTPLKNGRPARVENRQ